jgi:membrane-associated protease RseP (regulator of RpoE activity)
MVKEYFSEKTKWVAPPGEPPYGKAERNVVLPQKRPKILINVVLFILTIGTTLFAGALQQGVNPFQEPGRIIEGVPFSFALLFILLSHEMGHYLASKKHHIDATLPYFIPAPTFIGTFGAIIKMRSPLRNKKVLFDIGAAGPLAGVVVTIPILIIGLKLSEVKIIEAPIEGELVLGTSLILSFLTHIIWGTIPDNYHVMIHPLGFAGWIGMLVTSLNLMPAGQLDGGHIAYAVFGRGAALISKLVVIVLLGLGIWGASIWLFWAFLLIFLLGIKHPPPLDYDVPLDRTRKIIGVITLCIFIATFIPVPFSVV